MIRTKNAYIGPRPDDLPPKGMTIDEEPASDAALALKLSKIVHEATDGRCRHDVGLTLVRAIREHASPSPPAGQQGASEADLPDDIGMWIHTTGWAWMERKWGGELSAGCWLLAGMRNPSLGWLDMTDDAFPRGGWFKASPPAAAPDATLDLPDVSESERSADHEARIEKRRRIYYQEIVYDVCTMLDKYSCNDIRSGEGVVCGTADTPCRGVQNELERVLRQAQCHRRGAPDAEPVSGVPAVRENDARTADRRSESVATDLVAPNAPGEWKRKGRRYLVFNVNKSDGDMRVHPLLDDGFLGIFDLATMLPDELRGNWTRLSPPAAAPAGSEGELERLREERDEANRVRDNAINNSAAAIIVATKDLRTLLDAAEAARREAAIPRRFTSGKLTAMASAQRLVS